MTAPNEDNASPIMIYSRVAKPDSMAFAFSSRAALFTSKFDNDPRVFADPLVTISDACRKVAHD